MLDKILNYLPFLKKYKNFETLKWSKNLFFIALIISFAGYYLYSLTVSLITIAQQSQTEPDILNYLLLDGVRIFLFIFLFQGLLLIGLARRRKIAYIFLITETVLAVSRNLLGTGDVFTGLLNIALLVLFLLNWNMFTLYNPKFILEKRFFTILASLSAVSVLQDLGFKILRDQFSNTVEIFQVIFSYIYTLINPRFISTFERLHPKTDVAWAFLYIVLFAGAIYMVSFLYLLIIPEFKTIKSHLHWKDDFFVKLLKKDPDPLALFKLAQTLREFKHKSVKLFYTSDSQVCFVLGDPVIESSYDQELELLEALKKFRDDMHKEGKVFCFYQTSQKYLKVYDEMGFMNITFAQEAIVENTFDLTTSHNKDLRNSLNRLKREGVEFEIKPFDEVNERDLKLFQTLRNVWQSKKSKDSPGFTTGYDQFNKKIDGWFVVARGEDFGCLALCTFLPYGSKNMHGLSLDFMLKSPFAHSSVMEGIIAHCLEYFFTRGYSEVSLGLVPSKVMQNNFIGVIAKIFNFAYTTSGLRSFKQKFKPRWDNRLLIIESIDSLPLILSEAKKLIFRS